MQQRTPSDFKFYARSIILVTALGLSGCTTLRPMPKLTRGLTNPAKQEVNAINASGTEFTFKFTDKNKDGTYQFDKWVCAPGEQVVDMAAWLQELLVVVKNGAKK